MILELNASVSNTEHTETPNPKEPTESESETLQKSCSLRTLLRMGSPRTGGKGTFSRGESITTAWPWLRGEVELAGKQGLEFRAPGLV